MNYFTDDQLVVRQSWLVGPLAGWLVSFAKWLSAKGYAARTIHVKVRLISGFSLWLKEEAIEVADITLNHLNQYLQYRRQCQASNRKGEKRTLEQCMDYLQRKGQIVCATVPEEPKTSVELCMQSYEGYLRHVSGLAPTTIAAYQKFVRSILQHCFASEKIILSCLSSQDVVEFVQQQAPRLHPKRAKYMSTALRSFLRYASYLGETSLELVGAVPSSANWQMLSIPRGICTEQTEKLLASIHRDTATGRRDYAIVMLFARLGLRVIEVQRLSFDDIDWVNGTLQLQTKGNKRRTVPLTEEIGEAIVDYLYRGRPKCASRHVFVRAKAPVEGFRNVSSICAIIGRAIARGGIVAPTNGTHQFRHGLAIEMLRRKLSLEQIGTFWVTPTPTLPESMPRSIWKHCVHWPFPGRGMPNEYASRSHPRIY